MAEQTITVTVTRELTFNVPDGYELTGEYREPKKGELYLDEHVCDMLGRRQNPLAVLSHHDYENLKFAILREQWKAPSWMPHGSWLFKSERGTWMLGPKQPRKIRVARYSARCGYSLIGSVTVKNLAVIHNTNFIPPPNTDCIQVQHKG